MNISKLLRAVKITAAVTAAAILLVGIIVAVVVLLFDHCTPEPPPLWLYLGFLLTLIVGICKIIYDSQT